MQSFETLRMVENLRNGWKYINENSTGKSNLRNGWINTLVTIRKVFNHFEGKEQNIGLSLGHPIADVCTSRVNIPKSYAHSEVLFKLNKSNCHPERSVALSLSKCRRTVLQRLLMLALFLISILSLTSCSFIPGKVKPINENDIPTSFQNENTQIFTHEQVAPVRWWESFENQELNEIVDKVIENNLDLKIAVARMEMLESQFKAVRGSRMPAITAGGTVANQEGPVTGMQVTTNGVTQTKTIKENDSYALRTGLRFELDIWGKLRAQHIAAVETFKASKEELETIYIGIISQAIISYYNIQTQIEEVEISKRKYELAQHNYNVVEKKYKMGIINKTGYEATRQTLNNLKIKLKRDNQTLDNIKNQLAVLMGEFPEMSKDDVSLFKSDFTKLDFPKAIPSEVIKNRSDIVSAGHQMEAARQSAGAAFADFFPTISLNAAMNFASLEIDEIFEDINLTKSVSGDVSQTVFAGGAKLNSYKAKKSQYEQAILNYKKTVLNAFIDVEDALKGIEVAILSYNSSEENLESARSIYLINKRKYELGAISFNDLQQAEQSYLAQKSSMNLAKKGLVAVKIQLHSALGGKWVETVKR
jgi:NodT family efflux transporter outer membrane factor (OMF) lipoprotein